MFSYHNYDAVEISNQAKNTKRTVSQQSDFRPDYITNAYLEKYGERVRHDGDGQKSCYIFPIIHSTQRSISTSSGMDNAARVKSTYGANVKAVYKITKISAVSDKSKNFYYAQFNSIGDQNIRPRQVWAFEAWRKKLRKYNQDNSTSKMIQFGDVPEIEYEQNVMLNNNSSNSNNNTNNIYSNLTFINESGNEKNKTAKKRRNSKGDLNPRSNKKRRLEEESHDEVVLVTAPVVSEATVAIAPTFAQAHGVFVPNNPVINNNQDVNNNNNVVVHNNATNNNLNKMRLGYILF